MDAVSLAPTNLSGMNSMPLIIYQNLNGILIDIVSFSCLLSHRNCGEMAAHDDNDMNESASPCGQGSHSQVCTAHIQS